MTAVFYFLKAVTEIESFRRELSKWEDTKVILQNWTLYTISLLPFWRLWIVPFVMDSLSKAWSKKSTAKEFWRWICLPSFTEKEAPIKKLNIINLLPCIVIYCTLLAISIWLRSSLPYQSCNGRRDTAGRILLLEKSWGTS